MSNKVRYLTLAGMQTRDESLHVALILSQYSEHGHINRHLIRCHGCGEGSSLTGLEESIRRQVREHAATCTGVPEGWEFPPNRCYHPPTR